MHALVKSIPLLLAISQLSHHSSQATALQDDNVFIRSTFSILPVLQEELRRIHPQEQRTGLLHSAQSHRLFFGSRVWKMKMEGNTQLFFPWNTPIIHTCGINNNSYLGIKGDKVERPSLLIARCTFWFSFNTIKPSLSM